MNHLGFRPLALTVAILACDAPRATPLATADSLREEGRFADAHQLYRTLRDSLSTTGDTASWWHAQLWWAQTLMRVGQNDSAARALVGAFALTQGVDRREGWTRFLQCGLWNRRGRADSALAECGRSLALARQAGDGELEARVHFQQGTIHSRRGRFRESVAETEQALTLERRHGRSRYQLAGTLNSMGIEYTAVGRLGEAERMYQEGLELARTFGSPWYALYLLSNLAFLRSTTGDPAEALRLMNESYRHAEVLADTQAMVYALNSTAEFYLRAGNNAAARQALEQALTVGRRVTPIYQVITMVDLGQLAIIETRLDEAADLLERARARSDESDFGLQSVQSRVGLTQVAIARGAPQEALRWAEEAVRIADSLGSPEASIDAIEARADALEAAGRADATDGYLNGIALLESWRGRLTLGDLSVGVAAPRWTVYEGAIRTLLARGRAGQAFEVAERGRARLLLELMAERDASRPASSPQSRLARTLRARFQEREAVTSEADRQALDQDLAAITDSLAALGQAGGDPREAARNPRPATLADLRPGLVSPGKGLLAYFWGDRDVYGWWIGPDSVQGARLGPADSLGALVEFLRDALTRPAGDSTWRGPAALAWRRFVRPLTAVLPADLFVVADGPLAYLPFEALIADSAPLGGGHRITYGPSGSVLLSLVKTPTGRPWERGVLAVGNPAGGTTASPPPTDGFRDDGLTPLPAAADEARAVYRLLGPDASDLLLGRRATRERWLGLSPGRYRYLHFAAHALVDDTRPERTRLVLADGGLTLSDIRGLPLHAELVTLSACETALGRRVRGEGVIGLPHAFLAAGARGAVVSLWRVGDRATAEFMQEFYVEVAAGKPAAEALREVRRSQIAAGQSPAVWAGFILVGGTP